MVMKCFATENNEVQRTFRVNTFLYIYMQVSKLVLRQIYFLKVSSIMLFAKFTKIRWKAEGGWICFLNTFCVASIGKRIIQQQTSFN